jgi:7-keto-8-aminopelargonate synthetase-like enzyme
MFGRPAVATASAALTHLAALPALVRDGDTVLIDERASANLRAAVDLIIESGKASVESVRENDLARALARHTAAGRVWYVADGVCARNGARLDAAKLDRLMHRYPALYAYIDDTHGVGWFGCNGTGVAFDAIENKQRLYLTFGFTNAFDVDGAAMIVPDESSADTLRKMTASRLFHAPAEMIEEATQAAWRMQSFEAEDDRLILMGVIQNFVEGCDERGIALADRSESPVFVLKSGGRRIVLNSRMRAAELNELLEDCAAGVVFAKTA